MRLFVAAALLLSLVPAAVAAPPPPTRAAKTFLRVLFVEKDAAQASYLVDPRLVHPARLSASVGRFARSGSFQLVGTTRESCRPAVGQARTCFRAHLLTHEIRLAERTVVGVAVTVHVTLVKRQGRWLVAGLTVATASRPVCGIVAYNDARRRHDTTACRLAIPYPA